MRARYFVSLLALLVPLAAHAQRPAAPRGALAFVSNEGSNDVSVIDLVSRTVVATIPMPARPRGIQASADGRSVFVAVSDASPNIETAKDVIVQIDVRS